MKPIASGVPRRSPTTGLRRAVARWWAAASGQRLAGALVAVQLATIVVFGVLTVQHFFIFAPVDERAHYSYVQILAEQHRLPLVDRDYVSTQVESITDDLYPLRSPIDSRLNGLRGRSYEAFQPPLYYLMAVPVFDLSSNYLDRVRLLRGFDLVLMLAALVALAALAREVSRGRGSLLAFSLGLTVLMWPGVLVRAITVSNASLELPLVLWFLYAASRSWRTRSARWLLVTSIIFGLCLLTKLTLVYLGPVLLILAIRRRSGAGARRALAEGVAVLLIPLILLAPWIAFNERHFHAPTANAVARTVQKPQLNKHNHHYSAADLPSLNAGLLDPLLPEEWSAQAGGPAVTALAGLFDLVLLGGLVIAAARARRERPDRPPFVLLGLPLVLCVVMMNLTTLFADWSIFQARYLFSVLPALAILSALVIGRRRALLGVSALLSVSMVGLWTSLAVVYYS